MAAEARSVSVCPTTAVSAKWKEEVVLAGARFVSVIPTTAVANMEVTACASDIAVVSDDTCEVGIVTTVLLVGESAAWVD